MDKNKDITLRRFANEDADDVSQLIIDNLSSVNIHDYGEEAIRQLIPFYSPRWLTQFAQNGEMYVAEIHSRIVGTATLEQDRIRNVFVRTDCHRQGIGRILMQHIEGIARQKDKSRLFLHAGVSAAGFYQNLGFFQVDVMEENIGTIPIKMIRMEKLIPLE
jgi:N-acetylglutamate synthase-like GNAT family acetyltransferase